MKNTKMFMRILAVALAAAMLCGIGLQAFAEDDLAPYRTGSPWICSCLEGLVTDDMVGNVSLKDDFYLAVNCEKILNTVIPAGYTNAGTMISGSIALDSDIEALFTDRIESVDDNARLAYSYYDLLMDWDGRDAAGAAPLKEDIERLEAVDTVDALLAYLSDVPYSEQVYGLLSVGTMSSFEDSNKKIICIDVFPSLILGDSAEYSHLTDYGAIMKEALSELAEKMLVKIGYSAEEAAVKIENAFALETLIADVYPTQEEQNSPDFLAKINNHYTHDGVAEISGRLPVLKLSEENLGFPAVDDYLVTLPAVIERFNTLLTDENLTMIKDYMAVRCAIGSASCLDKECYDWRYDCVSKINGVSDRLPDSVVAAATVAATFDWAVARLYSEAYLKQEDKDRISALVDDVLDRYHEIVLSADFLSDETKALSVEKLEAISKRILWPDDWSLYDYEGLEIKSPAEGGLLYSENKALADYAVRKMVKEYTEPRNPEKWGATPQTFNCFYNPQENSVYILGSFARGEIYNSEMTDEELYGSLGSVIGHEISHAFDSQGAQFDKNGNMVVWWGEDDIAAFSEKNSKLIDSFARMYPWEGEKYPASMYSGEACADMGGIKVMLLLASEKEDFDYDSFFRAYANLWLRVQNLQHVRNALLSDPHPMSNIRTNTTLQQFDEFLDFYGITEGDGMYLAPEDRVKIW